MSQKRKMKSARSHLAVADKTFMEIQNGDNPMGPEEIRTLIETKGGIWKRYEKFAAPKE